MTWYVETCEQGKEAYVARAVERKGYDAYLPTTVISHPVTHKGPKRTKRRLLYEIPLWPRHVFVNITDEDCLAGIQFAKGLRRTNGWAWRIKERQMLRFMMAIRDAVVADTEAHSKRLRKSKPKKGTVKLTAFEELGKYMDQIIGEDVVDFETGEIIAQAA